MLGIVNPRAILGSFVVVLATLFASGAPAAEETDAKEKARKLVTEGNRLFEERRFDAALLVFTAAYEAYPSSKIAYNIARAHDELGHLLEAAAHYEKFLAEAAEGSQRTKAEAELRELDSRLGKIVLSEGPVGAEVTIDGTMIGVLPQPAIRVMPGSHAIRATLPGFLDFETSVDVERAANVPVEVKLVRAEPVARTPVLNVDVRSDALPPADTSSSIFSEWWFWTAIGAVIVAGVGVGFVASRPADPFLLDAELGVDRTDRWDRF